MSQVLINQYLAKLDRIRKICGSDREGSVRKAFERLLEVQEKKSKDPTICAKFDTYRFADHKENVVDLLARVTTVSVETMRIVDAMREASR